MAAWTARTTAEEVAKYFSREINGKTILITGVTQGTLGAEVALQASRHKPAHLILAGRSNPALETTKSAIEEANAGTIVPIKLLHLDLASQKSVRSAAKEVLAYPGPLNVLINNAAIMAAPYGRSEDGLESQWATNHIGHFLFTNLVMPKLLESAKAGSPARVVNVSSLGHKRSDVRWDDYNFKDGATYDKWAAYGQTKTANILFSVALANSELGKKGSIQSYSCYPGRVKTNIARSIAADELRAAGWMNPDGTIKQDPALGWKTVPEGGASILAAAFDPSIGPQNGGYLVHSKVTNDEAAAYALDGQAAKRLWKLSEEIIGEQFLEGKIN